MTNFALDKNNSSTHGIAFTGVPTLGNNETIYYSFGGVTSTVHEALGITSASVDGMDIAYIDANKFTLVQLNALLAVGTI